MSGKWILLSAVVSIGLAGCATFPTGPTLMVLPGRGRTLEQFQSDDLFCRQWAAQQAGGTSATAPEQTTAASAAGTAGGEGTRAATSAAVDSSSALGPAGAGSGLAGGTAVGLDASRAEVGSVQWRYDIAYEQCMYAKGHRIPIIMQAPPQGSGTPPPPPPPGAESPPSQPPPRQGSENRQGRTRTRDGVFGTFRSSFDEWLGISRVSR